MSPRPRKRRSRTPPNSDGCRANSPASPTRCGAPPRGTGGAKNPRYRPELEKQLEDLMIIAGTPKQVIAKLRILLEETRPGILGVWGNDGNVTHEDAKMCIRLLGQEVFPAVREMAKELDLKSPFETNQPVSVDYMNGLKELARAAAEQGNHRGNMGVGGARSRSRSGDLATIFQRSQG